MSTAHETAALLPDPAELRIHVRALAVLDATISDDPRFCRYTYVDLGPWRGSGFDGERLGR